MKMTESTKVVNNLHAEFGNISYSYGAFIEYHDYRIANFSVVMNAADVYMAEFDEEFEDISFNETVQHAATPEEFEELLRKSITQINRALEAKRIRQQIDEINKL